MKREFSAGGVVYKSQIINNKLQVLFLLRRAGGGKDYRGSLEWTLPKGWIDEGETSEQAAVREVGEEVGAKVRVVTKLKTIKIFFTDVNTKERVLKFVTYFLMEWVADLPEGYGWETAETVWVDETKAREIMAYASEKELVQSADKLVKSKDGTD